MKCSKYISRAVVCCCVSKQVHVDATIMNRHNSEKYTKIKESFNEFCVCSTWDLFLCNRLLSRSVYIFVSASFIEIKCSKSISRAVVCCCVRLSKSGWKPNPFCWYTRTCVVISKRSCIVACFRLGIVMPVSVKFLRRKLLEN